MSGQLIELPILLLTQRAGSRITVPIKADPKYLHRLKELRLAQPLPAGRLADLEHFTHLRQLYLDCGTDRPETLEAIAQHVTAPLPVSIIVGLSIDRLAIELSRDVNLWRVYLDVSETDRPLRFADDATLAEVAVGRHGTLPDFTTWTRLSTLSIAIQRDAAARDVRMPPALLTIECVADGCCTLRGNVESRVCAPWTIERKGRSHLRCTGDVSGFDQLAITDDAVFSGVPLDGVEKLIALSRTYALRDLREMILAVPRVRKLELRYARGVEYTKLVREFQSIGHFDFSLDRVDDGAHVEETAACLRDCGCRTTAAVSTGAFTEEIYDSNSGIWQSNSTR